MNAIEFLISEHQKVKKMLEDINDNSHKAETKHKLFDKLSAELLCHEAIEHSIWYPEFKHNEKLDNTVKHLISEENHAAKKIDTLKKVTAIDLWDKEFKKFKQAVEHHAAEEETKLFPNVRKILTAEKLEQIGKKMHQFKEEYRTN